MELSADLPCGVSAEQFARLAGVPASAHFMHEILNAVGEAAALERVVPDAEIIAQRVEAVPAGTRRRPALSPRARGPGDPRRQLAPDRR